MIGVVVVTHGQLATELVNAAEMIVGDLPQFTAVSIGWHDDVNDAREDIAQAIERVRGDGGVLLLTDMFGGTPSNLGMTFLETDRLEVITGVNLPMLIKLASLRSRRDLLAVAREMRDHGRNAIWVASDLLRGRARRTRVTVARAVTVVNQLGMHARAAAKFVHLATRFESRVRVGAAGPRDGRQEHHGHPAAGGRAGLDASRSPPTAPTSRRRSTALVGAGRDPASARTHAAPDGHRRVARRRVAGRAVILIQRAQVLRYQHRAGAGRTRAGAARARAARGRASSWSTSAPASRAAAVRSWRRSSTRSC